LRNPLIVPVGIHTTGKAIFEYRYEDDRRKHQGKKNRHQLLSCGKGEA
jgi:hypothetical protein